ncbi:MAG: hypothetical protein U0359_07740 [Byssovorax sp.]
MNTHQRVLGLAMAATLALAGAGCGTTEPPGDGGTGGSAACTDADPFCHPHGGKRWGEEKTGVTFAEAKAYCEGLSGKLPSISDLRTLFADCPATEPGGACDVTDTCTTEACLNEACVGCGDGGHNVFGNEDPFWSGTAVSDKPGQHFLAVYRYSLISALDDEKAMSAYCIAP